MFYHIYYVVVKHLNYCLLLLALINRSIIPFIYWLQG